MQWVNCVYEKGNLFQLFELQLEIEQIDWCVIDGFGEVWFICYNGILEEQLCEFDQEIVYVEYDFWCMYGIVLFIKVVFDIVLCMFVCDIVGMQWSNQDLIVMLCEFEDLDQVRNWLKDMKCWFVLLCFDDELY